MFKNRFFLIAAVLFVLIVSLAVSKPFSNVSKSVNVDWPARPIIVPLGKADYLSDYYERHPELRGGLAVPVDPAPSNPPVDECVDVSLSELAACREAGQSTSQ
jgi:hypothetical protein